MNIELNKDIQTPRALSTNGSALPSARAVSVLVFASNDDEIPSTTLAVMQFGQFINHDMESTNQFTYSNKLIMLILFVSVDLKLKY